MRFKIYVEGGGERTAQKEQLRLGMSKFLGTLRQRADKCGMKVDIVFCGPRSKTYEKFYEKFKDEARKSQNGDKIFLLVDSEDSVRSEPHEHLSTREKDKWDFQDVDPKYIHLMAQCMEAWLVADPDALAQYYDRGFKSAVLPKTKNLEEVASGELLKALEKATQKTKKGKYEKIDHAAELLKRVDPNKSQERCPHCKKFFETVSELMRNAGVTQSGA
jgi:hypothetical protein